MKIACEALALELKLPFKLASNTSDIRNNALIRIQHKNFEGFGEASLPPYYPETFESVKVAINSINASELNVNDIENSLKQIPDNQPSAKCAVDLALHDLNGKIENKTLTQLLNVKAKPLESSFTIAIDTPEKMAQLAKESKLNILKIKLGTQNDLEIVKAIRQATNAKLRLDVNGGWTREQAEKLIPKLEDFDIELIEQPLAKDDIEGFESLKKKIKVPLFADESFQKIEQLQSLAKGCDGVVIKLMKSGGIVGALKAIKAAQALNLKIMISCMIESSLLVTAAAHLASLCDFVDLDGPLLIKNDQFDGLHYDQGKILLPQRPGIGVVIK